MNQKRYPNNDKLNLPVTKSEAFLPKPLSMDDYLKFVIFNLKHTVDKKVVREQKKLAVVNAHFSPDSIGNYIN